MKTKWDDRDKWDDLESWMDNKISIGAIVIVILLVVATILYSIYGK